MHFVTGGSFNGKASWVKEYYNLAENESFNIQSAYENDDLRTDFSSLTNNLIIINGLELFIKKTLIENEDIDLCQKYWSALIGKWLEFEKETNSQVVLIGSDITKGIVPLEKVERSWRDLVGFVYQDIVKRSSRVDLILYGISSQLK